MSGFFFGRTPLIKLSPKKTWEGFVGGLVGTLVLAFFLAAYMAQFKWMTCPRKVRGGAGRRTRVSYTAPPPQPLARAVTTATRPRLVRCPVEQLGTRYRPVNRAAALTSLC